MRAFGWGLGNLRSLGSLRRAGAPLERTLLLRIELKEFREFREFKEFREFREGLRAFRTHSAPEDRTKGV